MHRWLCFVSGGRVPVSFCPAPPIIGKELGVVAVAVPLTSFKANKTRLSWSGWWHVNQKERMKIARGWFNSYFLRINTTMSRRWRMGRGSRSGRTSTVLGTKQWHVTYVFVWGPVEKKKHAFYKFFISVGNNKRKDWMLWPRRGKKRMPTHLQ